MAHDQSRPASWKGDDRSSPQGSRRPGSGAKYSWKPGKTSGGPPAGRKIKAAFYSFLGIIVVAGMIGLFLLLRRQPENYLVVVASNPAAAADNLSLPFNIYGHKDAGDFVEWSNSGKRFDTKIQKTTPWPVRTGLPEHDWVAKLKDLSKEKDHKKNIIIYISQPGGVDENGDPYFFDEQANRWQVRALLEQLKPIVKNKLLILDATQIPTDWRQGVLVNRFAVGLKKLQPVIREDEKLIVLCSSSPDQRSWFSEEFGHSIFAHFLMEGLSGAALDQTTSAAVYPRNLVPYVQKNVSDWVKRNRMEGDGKSFDQVPFVLPEDAEKSDLGKNFILAYGEHTYKPKLAPDERNTASENAQTKQLSEAWQINEKLAVSTPGPWVYSPRGWRRYQELLLRYELALRVGDKSSADKLRGPISELATAIESERSIKAKELLNASLAMPAALGHDFVIDDAQMTPLLNKKDQLSIELTKLASGRDETVTRIKFVDFLLREVIRTPDKLAEYMTIVGQNDGGGTNRPADVHLAVMLHRTKPLPGAEKPDSELTKLALRVRRLADQAILSVGEPKRSSGSAPLVHPYSERLPEKLANDVADADADRRRGEDHLFAAKSFHAEAEKRLRDAEKNYKLVQSKSEPARRATEVRDIVFANLSSLGEWLAREMPRLSKEEQANLKSRLVKLWENAHKLAEAVERLDPLLGSADIPNDLQKQSTEVGDEFKLLAERYDQEASYLLTTKDQTLPSLRQRIENVLAVPGVYLGGKPLLKAADRAQLVSRSRSRSAELAKSDTKSSGNVIVAETELASYVAPFAKAMFGPRWSELAGSDDALGQLLAAQWKKLRDDTDREKTGETVIPWPTRERCGLLAGSAGARPSEPAMSARNKRWNATFLRLARRSVLDHWYDGVKPFSENIAIKFLEAMSPTDAVKRELKSIEDNLPSGRFRVQPVDERKLTTERDIETIFTINEINDNFKPGFAAIAPSMEKKIFEFDANKPITAKPLPLKSKQSETVSLHAPKPLDDESWPKPMPTVKLDFLGFYRGQVVLVPANFKINPVPDLTVNRPAPPEKAQIAARADFSLGAIAIILDCSASMQWDFNQPDNPKKIGRFGEAKNALKNLLATLPQGTEVSLWAYSYKGCPLVDGKYRIDKLKELTKWDRLTHEPIFSDVIDRLEAYGDTPLIESMRRAASDSDFKNALGNKTLVVLTDGCDALDNTRQDKAYNDAVAEKFRSIFLTDEADKEKIVAVHLILFQITSPKEVAIANAQFRDEDFAAIRRPSSKWTVEDEKKLKESLLSTIQPRVGLFRNGALVQMPSEIIALWAKRELDWSPQAGLKAFGDYQIDCRGGKGDISLKPGDKLALRIKDVSTKGVLGLQRILMADESEINGLRRLDGLNDQDPFVLGLTKRGVVSTTDIHGDFSLEVRPRPREAPIEVKRPAFTWWDFRPANSKDIPSGSMVTALYDDQAPTWRLECRAWPRANADHIKPSIQVWAKLEMPKSNGDCKLVPKGYVKDERFDGENVTVESARFEEFKTLEGVSNKLVIRLRSQNGNRYYPHITGINVVDEVHKYFDEAKSSTSVFTLPKQAMDMTLQIHVINIEKAKDGCVKLRKELID